MPVDVRAAGGRRGARAGPDQATMTLADLYRMVTTGRMGAAERAAAMIKFQAGLDSPARWPTGSTTRGTGR